MKCPQCQYENLPDSVFCQECGTKLERVCPQCRVDNVLTAKFCRKCGTPLTEKSVAPSPQMSPMAGGQKPGAKAKPAKRKAKDKKQGRAKAQEPTVDRRSSLLAERGVPEAERRQLTVMFCDLVGSTALSEQLDPEELREVVRAYQEVCAGVISRYEGHIAQYLGDTPNIAARVQGIAEPDTVVISGVTYRHIEGLFECQELGPQELKGVTTPLLMYRVVGESGVQSRFEVAVKTGLTPLVGREHELGLLLERWEQAKQGEGQVVLLSGEAGIGKSRLVQTLKEQVLAEGATRIEFRCSPYHQHSAFYPIIEYLQRLLQFAPREAPPAKLVKLTHLLAHYRFPQAETLPLLAALLSLPHPEGVPPSPQTPPCSESLPT